MREEWVCPRSVLVAGCVSVVAWLLTRVFDGPAAIVCTVAIFACALYNMCFAVYAGWCWRRAVLTKRAHEEARLN